MSEITGLASKGFCPVSGLKFKRDHCKNQKGPLRERQMERGEYPARYWPLLPIGTPNGPLGFLKGTTDKVAVLAELSRLNNFKLERNDSSWGFLVSQPSAILSPKAKPPTGLHFAQCPAGGLKRPQMAPTEAVLLGAGRNRSLADSNQATNAQRRQAEWMLSGVALELEIAIPQ
jgi:hypothetical protein